MSFIEPCPYCGTNTPSDKVCVCKPGGQAEQPAVPAVQPATAKEQLNDTLLAQQKRIWELEEALEASAALVGAKQAKIDLLMLEHCPDEMTKEQVAEWASHQVPAEWPKIVVAPKHGETWRTVRASLPEHGQAIEGCAELGAGVWSEVWDKDEPVGKMRYWRPAPATA
jgi:hypothetical protein